MTRKVISQVRIGPQGRVVIPAALRAALDLKPGDTLAARIDDGLLILEKREHILASLQAEFAVIPPEISLADELIAERRLEAQRESDR